MKLLCKRIPFLIIFLLFSGKGLFAQEGWYDKGRNAKHPREKVDFFTKSIETGERADNWVYYQRGWSYMELNKYDRAIDDFKTGLDKEGSLGKSNLFSAIAYCYYQLDKTEEGIKYVSIALELDAKNQDAWNLKGLLDLDNSDYQDAINSFSKYINLNPKGYIGYSYRSWAYIYLQEYNNVLQDCDKALELNPNAEYLVERKAFALMKMGKNNDAISLIKDKFEYKPDDPKSLSKLARLFSDNEDYETAIEYHNKGIALYNKKISEDREFIKLYNEDIYTIYINRGDTYNAMGDKQRALGDYKKATTIDPDEFLAWYNIGDLQTHQKNWSEGIKAYEKAFSIKPNYKDGWVNLGFCYDKLHQSEKAIDAYTRGIKNNPKVGLLYNNRGYGYLELKRYEEALADLNKAIEVQPEIVMSHVSLGEYYYERQMYQEAIKKFDYAIDMDYGSVDAYTAAYYTRGLCYFELKKYEEAKRDFISAIKLTPEHIWANEQLGISYYELEDYCNSYKTLKHTLDLESMKSEKEAKQAPKYLGKMTTNPCK